MRFLRWLAPFAFVLPGTLIAAACGRSTLDGYGPRDGSTDVISDVTKPDGATCGPDNCAGCCDESGACLSGSALTACGQGGGACLDCATAGFDYCDPTLLACVKDLPKCDVTTCPNGCCTTVGGTQACVSGASDQACGSGGQQCEDCKQTGEVCSGGKCTASTCGPQNCKGCCFGNNCVTTPIDTSCGLGGVECQNCTMQGAACDTGTGTCVPLPPQCNAQNCPNGCCQNGVCQSGTQDGACGTGGQACANCTQQGQVCSAQKCGAPPCNAQTCPTGCCFNGICNAGFANNRCGSGGVSCVDCTQQMSTCNTLVTPRTCNSQQTTCPAPYASCPGNVTTPPPVTAKGSCTAQDLLDARAACQAGRDTVACRQFWAFIAQQKPACSACLKPFDYGFLEAIGIYNCVAPFVSSQCNHNTGCVRDCVTKSCEQCPAQSVAQCETTVRLGGGQCQPYVQQTTCIAQALQGPGSFCSPASYFGNYGQWLQGVGNRYCGP
jgi:hypothetical protein